MSERISIYATIKARTTLSIPAETRTRTKTAAWKWTKSMTIKSHWVVSIHCANQLQSLSPWFSLEAIVIKPYCWHNRCTYDRHSRSISENHCGRNLLQMCKIKTLANAEGEAITTITTKIAPITYMDWKMLHSIFYTRGYDWTAKLNFWYPVDDPVHPWIIIDIPFLSFITK